MVVYCAADLLWSTRIKATADGIGVPCRPVRNLDMLRARLADSDVRGLIVDLETGDTGLGLIRALRAGVDGGETPDPPMDPEGRVRILAFGPHVAVEMFEEAKRAGADRVLARGAFDRGLVEVLRGLEGKGSGE
jgi:hypothetical protein